MMSHLNNLQQIDAPSFLNAALQARPGNPHKHMQQPADLAIRAAAEKVISLVMIKDYFKSKC